MSGKRKTVVRKEYLARLHAGKDDVDVIKVITGIRRCGKSTLMEQYADLLISEGVAKEQIIHINLESMDYDWIESKSQLYDVIRAKTVPGIMYILLDEVQRISDWEKAINGLAANEDIDLYITGSNAYLLSSELATYLSGRYIEIKMLPLSFKEFLCLNPVDAENNREQRFMQYIWLGSMPLIDLNRDREYTANLLQGVYNTIIYKDIEQWVKISDPVQLRNIMNFLMHNIGNITSSNNIAKYTGLSQPTIRSYLQALERSYIIYKANRYDIRGKKLLKTLEKYYVADTGMRNALLGSSAGDDISRQIENIVYLELIRRGYEVNVGCYRDLEVDFTAVKNNHVEYYQITQTMLPENVYQRETASLLSVDDNFPKTILSLDTMVRHLAGGIQHKNLIDWLLE
ncbi:ATP-binding protein [Candidatus Methanomassiliicoccus intestinalis]|uniref:ATP-binding protein n=1 Tax=Candidatus Methanomassiliicoccus intestinalis TaxID=1406512 RepID=UPI0037DD9FB2